MLAAPHQIKLFCLDSTSKCCNLCSFIYSLSAVVETVFTTFWHSVILIWLITNSVYLLYRDNSAACWCATATSRSAESRGWFCWPLFLSLPVRSRTSGELDRWWGENDRQDKGHSTWRWARAVSRGGDLGWRGSGGVESERAVHQQHVC